MKIFDRRSLSNDVEAEIQKEVNDLPFLIAQNFRAENVPGAWIKKYGYLFKHLKDFTSEHFNTVSRDIIDEVSFWIDFLDFDKRRRYK